MGHDSCNSKDKRTGILSIGKRGAGVVYNIKAQEYAALHEMKLILNGSDEITRGVDTIVAIYSELEDERNKAAAKYDPDLISGYNDDHCEDSGKEENDSDELWFRKQKPTSPGTSELPTPSLPFQPPGNSPCDDSITKLDRLT